MKQEFHANRMRTRAWHAVDAVIAAGALSYDRSRLSRLIPIAPCGAKGGGAAATRAIIRLLARAMRGERARGRAGHWTYDLNRHMGLLQALRAERERLACEESGIGCHRLNAKKAAPKDGL